MEEQEIIKSALEYLKASGAVGVDKTKLLSALRTLDGMKLSPEQRDYVFGIIEGRGWVTWHIDAVWHSKRWTLSVKGLEAYEAMQ